MSWRRSSGTVPGPSTGPASAAYDVRFGHRLAETPDWYTDAFVLFGGVFDQPTMARVEAEFRRTDPWPSC